MEFSFSVITPLLTYMQSTLSRRNGSTHVEADLDSEQHEPLIADDRQEQENEQVC